MTEYGDWREDMRGNVEYYTPSGWVDESTYIEWQLHGDSSPADLQTREAANLNAIASIVQSGTGAITSILGMFNKDYNQSQVDIARYNAEAAASNANTQQKGKIFGINKNVLIGGGILAFIVILLMFKKKKNG